MTRAGRRWCWLILAVAAGAIISIAVGACGGGEDEGNEPASASSPVEAESTPAEGPAAEVARSYLKQLASTGGLGPDTLWELTSSEIKATCSRHLFDRAMDQLRFRVGGDIQDYFALAGGAAMLLEMAEGLDWVVMEAPQAGLRLPVIREEEGWRVHPDLSTTYCSNAPPLPAVVEMAGVDLTPMQEPEPDN